MLENIFIFFQPFRNERTITHGLYSEVRRSRRDDRLLVFSRGPDPLSKGVLMGLVDSPLSSDLRPNLANLSKLRCVRAKRKNTSIPHMEWGSLGIRTPLLIPENQ
ncbi:unnamed protein product [Rangifer tarandus platyrhynchus]|uniref:Uncharacterized protein n=2 Tax=Rangifer tarandus platyrhynchus TaxID=3082113 RepID=A0ABN8ZE59_RANTA|nr:unnamed protein product [Rangifer tarandus platyrhynchus]